MVWVVSEHSSCDVMGMFSTAFRHLALMMFCMPCGQMGVSFFSGLPPISALKSLPAATQTRGNISVQETAAWVKRVR